MHPIHQIDAYLAGELTPGEKAAFELHLAGCPQCAEMVQHVDDVDALLTDVFYNVRPSADFEDRLLEPVSEAIHSTRPAVHRPWVGRLMRILSAPESPHRRASSDEWVGRIGVVLAASVAVLFLSLVATSVLGHKTSAMIGTLAAILPGNETADSGAMTSGSLIETTNDNGTIQINPQAATDSTNTDRLDFNTGLSAVENTTSALALDVDATS